jgi:hypothetical protein
MKSSNTLRQNRNTTSFKGKGKMEVRESMENTGLGDIGGFRCG